MTFDGHQKDFIVLSSSDTYHEGALICRIHDNARKVRLSQVPAFMVDGNDAHDVWDGDIPFSILRDHGKVLDATEALWTVNHITRRFLKTHCDRNMNIVRHADKWWEPKIVLDILLGSLDALSVGNSNVIIQKRLVNYYYQKYNVLLPRATEHLMVLLDATANEMAINVHARKIQRTWRLVVANPSFQICRSRLNREWEKMCA